jgi:transposase
MSTSELYHGQGIKGYTQRSVEYKGKDIIYHLVPQPNLIKCPCCGSLKVTTHGKVTKVIRGVPIIGRKNILFSIELPRVECEKCKVIRQINPGISEPKKRYTKAFANAAIRCVRNMSIQASAAHLGVDWHTVNDIFQDYLKKKYDFKRFKNVTRIGIDETYIGKRHKFRNYLAPPYLKAHPTQIITEPHRTNTSEIAPRLRMKSM